MKSRMSLAGIHDDAQPRADIAGQQVGGLDGLQRFDVALVRGVERRCGFGGFRASPGHCRLSSGRRFPIRPFGIAVDEAAKLALQLLVACGR